MYRGVIIEESLEDKSVFDDLKVVETEIETVTEGFQTPWLTQWTLRTVEIPDEQADEVASKLATAIDRSHASSWFADFANETTHFVIFSEKVFKIDRSSMADYESAKQYALSIGIPEHQLGFMPKR